jgi:hypothetical protein
MVCEVRRGFGARRGSFFVNGWVMRGRDYTDYRDGEVMDVSRIVAELRLETGKLDQAIESLERLSGLRGSRLKVMKGMKRRNDPNPPFSPASPASPASAAATLQRPFGRTRV